MKNEFNIMVFFQYKKTTKKKKSVTFDTFVESKQKKAIVHKNCVGLQFEIK